MALFKNSIPGSGQKAGFKKSEFLSLIGLANRYNAIKDCRPFQQEDHITIYLYQCARQKPCIWIEKYRNGPDKALFVAWTQGVSGNPVSIARSEKFSSFMEQIDAKLNVLENISHASSSDTQSVKIGHHA